MLNAELQALLDDLRSAPQDQFQVSQFVRQCRQVAPLSTLSDLLAQHGNKLQHELVQLLNSDFEQYISLSVSLQGTDQIVEHLLDPIYHIRSQLLSLFLVVYKDYEDVNAVLDEEVAISRIRKKMNCSLPAALSDLIPDSKHGDIERQARAAAFKNDITLELKRDLQLRLIQLLSSQSIPDRYEISSIFRAFSFCGLHDLIVQYCKDYIVSRLSPSNSVLDFPDLFGNEETLKLASRCSILDDVSCLRYEILIRCFFLAISHIINREQCAKTFFSTGSPAIFHRNFTAYMRLLSFMETLQPGISRNTHVVAITAQFKPEIYFRLRNQAIIMRLESGLQGPLQRLDSSPVDPMPAVSLKVTALVCSLSYSCFNDDVFIRELAAKFFSLSLQIISRFSLHITSLLQANRDSSILLTLADDVVLSSNWVSSVLMEHCKSQLTTDRSNSEQLQSLIEKEFRSHANKLISLHEILKETAVRSVIQLSETALEAVPRIKALYRMSGQNQARSPLEYVAQVVAPLKDALSQIHSSKDRDSLSRHAIRIVSKSYCDRCSKLLEVMLQTESSLRKFGNTTSSNALANTSVRIAEQLKLDVEEYRRLLKQIAGDSSWGIDEAVDDILQTIDKSVAS